MLTALMYAVRSAQLEVVELLISAGAQVDAKDSWNRTVWDYMASMVIDKRSSTVPILKKILASYPPPFPENGPTNVFLYALNVGDLPIIKILLPVLKDQGVMDRRFLTASICTAARGGNNDKTATHPIDIMELFRIELGAIPDDTLGCVAPGQSVEKYEYLLSYGANPNAMSESGVLTGVLPLRMAVLNTHADRAERIRAIETLLKYGADPTLKDEMNGVSALESARAQGDSAIVEMFERANTNK